MHYMCNMMHRTSSADA